MPPRHFLRCLGLPELRGPGGEPVRFRTRKHLALLVFLATERQKAHSRDHLADLLWPEARPSEGRHSVATALSYIRGKLGPRTFETTRDTVRLLAPDLEVDLERLARGDVLGDDLTPPLEVAGFLDGFEVGHAAEYMLWRDIMRAHWFPQIRAALIVLMDRCRRTGDFTRIETHADRLLVLDELCEEGIRAKMEARAFAGDRLTSIRIFQAWRQRLKDELDAVPSRLVEGMALRLRQRGYEPPGTAHIPTVPTDQWRHRAFVGRASQYRVLYERWESTNKREGRHGLVLGESGIGKTTLVERLVTAAGLEGAVSDRVQCYEVEREIPYAAIGTLVRGLLDRPGASGTPPEWLAELARNIPAVAKRYPDLPPARETVGETARLRLTEAVHELATAVSEEHPVILVVDDVHLADDASVAVLHLLMRRTQAQPIMIIMSARESELARSPHASRLMDSREPLALTAVELPPLVEEEMQSVITALAAEAGVIVPPAVRQAMLRTATGIPLLAELLFDDWRLNGDQCLALTVGAMTVDALGAPEQEVYRRVFDRVFRDLSPEARAVVNLAAILGDRLNDLGMYELVDLTLAQTLTGMSELAALRILRDGGREVEFRNELLRNYTYLHVPSPLRRALHGLIADRLLRAEAEGERVPGLMLAWHCFRAGRPMEAEPYLLRGSSEALRRGGVFEVELALTSAMGTLSSESAREAHLLLAEALQEQNRHREALRIVERGWPTGVGATIREEIVRARSLSMTIAVSEEARRLADYLEGLLSTESARAAWPAILFMLAELSARWGWREPLRSYLALARNVEADGLDLEDTVRVQYAVAFFSWHLGERSNLLGVAERFASLERRCREGELANLAAWSICSCNTVLHTSRGLYSEALVSSTFAYGIAYKIGNEPKMSSAALNCSICELRLGHYLRAESWAAKAIAHAARLEAEWPQLVPLYYWSLALCMMGENQKALTAAEKILAIQLHTAPEWYGQVGPLLTADIRWACGDQEGAKQVAREALSMHGARPIADRFAGTYWRWASHSAFGSSEVDDTTAQVRLATSDLDSYDLVDQAELIGSRLRLEKKCGGTWPEGTRSLAGVLSRLPSPVEAQLRRLGGLQL